MHAAFAYTFSRGKGATPTKETEMHVLTLIFDDGENLRETTEIHALNPGETLIPFGGSKSGLRVGKTASIVTRRISQWGTHDIEHDVYGGGVWSFIAGLINDNAHVRAYIPKKED